MPLFVCHVSDFSLLTNLAFLYKYIQYLFCNDLYLINIFTKIENSALNVVKYSIIEKKIEVEKYQSKSDFMKISLNPCAKSRKLMLDLMASPTGC